MIIVRMININSKAFGMNSWLTILFSTICLWSKYSYPSGLETGINIKSNLDQISESGAFYRIQLMHIWSTTQTKLKSIHVHGYRRSLQQFSCRHDHHYLPSNSEMNYLVLHDVHMFPISSTLIISGYVACNRPNHASIVSNDRYSLKTPLATTESSFN